MNTKKWISLLICFVMVVTCITPAFADAGSVATSTTDETTWTPADFTYGEYEKLLYGCDYTREIVVKGQAITGFSASGEAKLANNKDLVIPATTPDGELIVGIGQSAFAKKGLTSVEFPTGMMVGYDDTITKKVTKRGNFVIAESAFAGNKLTSVTLPEGVIAVLPHAFNNNKLETVKLPRTIWWLETYAFANNRITDVNFPTTCDFQLEMHGMTFAHNLIKAVRLPDFTEVVNKHIFFLNPGMEPIVDTPKPEDFENYTKYEIDGQSYTAGIVHMYADNSELEAKDRIHHIEKSTASQKSYVQRLIINDGSQAPFDETDWNIDDFTVEGTVITGLSESGVAKRAINKDLVIPDLTADYRYVTEIAAAEPGGCGLFATETEKFDSVYLPMRLKKVGDYAFQNSGLKDITFPWALTTIGKVAFQSNNLTSVILPDTVTDLGMGAFATNPELERISLSKGLTTIPEAAFGCSDAKHYMTNLKSIELHEGITDIGVRAFAGNNFSEIVMPSTVKTIGDYAFSTKNYLKDPCTVTLNAGLETIGTRAFRNKVIHKIVIPESVTKISDDTFEKAYSDDTEVVITKVFVSLESQYNDKENFPVSDFHKVYLMDASKWTSDDFTYGKETFSLSPAGDTENVLTVEANVVTGFSESGLDKFDVNKDVVIPETDGEGNKVQGIGTDAFKGKALSSIKLPENVTAEFDGSLWTKTRTAENERGDFFIGDKAFYGTGLTTVDLPEGLIYVGENAFEGNELIYVEIPESLMILGNRAFADNNISTVNFPAETQFALQIEAQAFAFNKLKIVQLPSNISSVGVGVFLQNTGMETLETEDETEKGSGIVYMYINIEDASQASSLISHDANQNAVSAVQKLTIGAAPDTMSPWGLNDFTFDEAGTTITGLSSVGQLKLQENPELVLPTVGPTGETITALGEGTNYTGIFTYTDGEKYYAPKSIDLPDSLKVIGKYAFALNPTVTYEAEMTSIDFPKGLEEIGTTAFQSSKLTAIDLPNSITTLGEGAFVGSGNVKTIKLPEGLTTIPKSAFNAGSVTDMKVESIVIPEGVKVIGEYAFAGTHVENLVLPQSITEIKQSAFMNHQLTELILPSNVTAIGNGAFRIAQENLPKKLTNVVLNEGLVTIGEEAFFGNAITEIYLPSTTILTATNTSDDLLFGTARFPASPIVTIRVADQSKVDEFNTEYANNYSHIVVLDKLAGSGWTMKDFLFDEKTGTLLGWSDSGKAKRLENKVLVLPDKTPEGKDIVTIGERAFMIPSDEVTVTKFGIDSPNGMTSVALPAKVTKIEAEAFAQNALTIVDLTTVTSIGYHAFYGNDLTKVELPDTVTVLGEGAFATNDITELKLSAGVTKIPQGAFSMNIRMEHVTIPDTVTEIGTTAFAGARLTSLTIPKSVTKIGEKAFHLHHLSELTIPGNVKELGKSAFEGTFKATTLTNLTLEEGVESIGENCFKEALLETVHFPDSLKTVGKDLFLNNKGLNSSGVVEVTTRNRDHLAFVDDTYIVKYLGIDIRDYKDKCGLEYTETEYTGQALEPKLTIDGLTEGTDFEVSYINNTKAGTATVEVKGLGEYSESFTKTFTIKPCTHTWDSGKVTKAPTCTATGVKTSTCTVAGCGATKTETIAKAAHSYSSSYTVDKKATLSENGSKSKHCTKCSAKTSVTAIPKVSSVSLSSTAYTYNGKAQKPSVTVKNSKGTALKNGTDYSVSYASGRTKIGRYKVTVTLKGAYSGSKTLYFTIGPKNPSSVKTVLYGYDDVKVSWSKVSGASGYQVYYKKSSASSYKLLKTTTSTSYKKSNLDDGVKYDFKVVAYKTVSGNKCYNAGKTSSITTLKKVSGVKATKSSSKVKVSWTNIGGETGYQISQSTSKSKTNVVATYKTTSGKSKTISATKGKTYYYKVRAYKTVGDKKIYGPWSSVVKYKR